MIHAHSRQSQIGFRNRQKTICGLTLFFQPSADDAVDLDHTWPLWSQWVKAMKDIDCEQCRERLGLGG